MSTLPPTLTRRGLLGALGAAGIAAGLTACTNSPAATPSQSGTGRLKVAWWGGDERHTATLDAIKVLEDQLKLDISTEYGDWGGYWDKLTTQMSGGNAPDVVQMNFTPQLVEYSARGALLPLDEYVGSALDLGALSTAEVNGGRIGEKLYGVTLASLCPAVMVNATKLSELGIELPDKWTWDTFAESANSIYEASSGKLHGVEDDSANGIALESWMLQKGFPGIYTQNKLSGSVDDYVEWFEYWDALRRSGGCVTAEINAAADGSHPNNPVVKGAAAMGLQFNITQAVWATLTPDKIGYAIYPQRSDSDVSGNYSRPASLFSVNAASPHTADAIAFISAFINDPKVAKTLGFTRGVPNQQALDAIGTDMSEADRELADFTTKVLTGKIAERAPQAPLGSGEVNTLLTKFAGEVSFGKLAPADGARKFFAAAADVALS